MTTTICKIVELFGTNNKNIEKKKAITHLLIANACKKDCWNYA